MGRKDYGCRFPMKPIVKRTAPVATVVPIGTVSYHIGGKAARDEGIIAAIRNYRRAG